MEKDQQMLLRDLTQGSIIKNIFVYAWPLLIANSLQAIYNIVDMLVVGRVEGQIGLAAVSVGADLLFLVMALIMGFASAGQVLIAQATGAGETGRIKKLIGNLYSVSLIISLVMGVICLFADDWFLRILNTPASAYEDAKKEFSEDADSTEILTKVTEKLKEYAASERDSFVIDIMVLDYVNSREILMDSNLSDAITGGLLTYMEERLEGGEDDE